jgi:hypothetical protein
MPTQNNTPKVPLWEWLTLLAILCVALLLRTREIEAFYIGPDDGAYLHSAQVQNLERGFRPIEWVREDVAWVRYLADNYSERLLTYQHSYLHQLVARYLYRFGFGALEALRWSSALTGVLTVLLVWWMYARLSPGQRRIGLFAAAILSVLPLHVFLSRTGWGQVGFTCFYTAFLVFLYRTLFVIDSTDTLAFVRAGFGMFVSSLFAFGYHEGVAPYLVGSGVVVLVHAWLRRTEKPGPIAWLLGSKRVWTYTLAVLPVMTFTLLLALFSTFAKGHWFDAEVPKDMSWPELKLKTLENVFVDQRLDLQLTWPVLAAALLGVFALLKRDGRLARYLLASAFFGGAILFLLFGHAQLLRAYMPLIVIIAVFAGEGVFAFWRMLSMRIGVGAAALFPVALIAMLALITWTSLFGELTHPLFIHNLYAQGDRRGIDHRYVDTDLYAELLARRKPGELVAVNGDKAAIFRLLAHGIVAREDYEYRKRPRSEWPIWVVAPASYFEREGHTVEKGGPYRLVIKDNVGRHGLYRLDAP